NYALTLDLPDTGATIRGRAVLTIARSSHADTLRLDLIALHVDSVLVNDRATTFVRDDTSIRIPLPAGGNDTLAVAVRYAGAPSDGLIIRTDSTGRWTAFGDNWPQRARYWIPSIDEPDAGRAAPEHGGELGVEPLLDLRILRQHVPCPRQP